MGLLKKKVPQEYRENYSHLVGRAYECVSRPNKNAPIDPGRKFVVYQIYQGHPKARVTVRTNPEQCSFIYAQDLVDEVHFKPIDLPTLTPGERFSRQEGEKVVIYTVIDKEMTYPERNIGNVWVSTKYSDQVRSYNYTANVFDLLERNRLPNAAKVKVRLKAYKPRNMRWKVRSVKAKNERDVFLAMLAVRRATFPYPPHAFIAHIHETRGSWAGFINPGDNP